MAKKLTENPGAGPDRVLDPVADPVLSAMAAAGKAQPNPQPLYYQRGIPGRDGTGEWRVGERGAIMMPNGDYAKPGDTFSQREEGFNDAQIRHLVGSFIEQNKTREAQPHMVPKPVKVTKPLAGEIIKKDGANGASEPSSC